MARAGERKARLVDFLRIWEDSEECVLWCQDNQLFREEQMCPLCHGETILVPSAKQDGWMWRCRHRGCQRRVSIRADSIFEGSKLSISKCLQLLYWWASDLTVAQATHEVGLSQHTVIDWFLRFREICAQHLLAVDRPIGRPRPCRRD